MSTENATVENEQVQTVETTTQTATETVENNSEFAFTAPVEESEQAQVAPIVDTPKPLSIKELAATNKKELLSELGMDWADDANEFVKGIAQHLKNGGNAYDYLEAKAVDYTKMGDADLVLKDFAKQYPNLSDEEIKDLFEDTYKQGEYDEEEDKRRGLIRLKAAGHNLRQAAIEKQKNFTLPAPIQKGDKQVDNPFASIVQEAEQLKEYALTHESTKTLHESKKVAIDAGEYGKVFLSIENPQLITDFMTNDEVYRKYANTKEGKPDLYKQQLTAAISINPQLFIKSLIERGVQIERAKQLETGRNAVKPTTAAVATATETPRWTMG